MESSPEFVHATIWEPFQAAARLIDLAHNQYAFFAGERALLGDIQASLMFSQFTGLADASATAALFEQAMAKDQPASPELARPSLPSLEEISDALGDFVKAFPRLADAEHCLGALQRLPFGPCTLAGVPGETPIACVIRLVLDLKDIMVESSSLKLIGISEGTLDKHERHALLGRWGAIAPVVATRFSRIDKQENAAVERSLAEAEKELQRNPVKPKPPKPVIDLEAQATALLFDKGNYDIRGIAERLGVDRKTLYRWRTFRAAAERVGKLKPRKKTASPLKGFKEDGQIEAYDGKGWPGQHHDDEDYEDDMDG